MLIVKSHGYKRKYVYGGSGIFDTVSSIFKGLLSSDASKALAKQAASTALDIGKTAATNVGKKLVDKAVNKIFTPKPTMVKHDLDELKRRANEVISKYIDTGANDINKLVDGSGKRQNAIAIQNLVRKMNGSGLKVV